jgi:hypothetical protein
VSSTDYEIKPVAIQPAVPKAQHNGLFGMEAALIDSPSQEVTAIVTYAVASVPAEQIEGIQWPVLKVKHIEPLKTPEEIAAALALRDAAYKERVGADQLDLDGGESVAEKEDAEFEAAAPKGEK